MAMCLKLNNLFYPDIFYDWQGFRYFLYKKTDMKLKLIHTVSIVALIFVIAFCLSGCYEPQYYHHYGHHTRPWYERHHREPPAGVNFEIDIYKRHY